MDDEKEKLITLLNYLIEHNAEHSMELTELAKNSEIVDSDIVRSKIQEAARVMSESTEYLKQALAEVNKD